MIDWNLNNRKDRIPAAVSSEPKTPTKRAQDLDRPCSDRSSVQQLHRHLARDCQTPKAGDHLKNKSYYLKIRFSYLLELCKYENHDLFNNIQIDNNNIHNYGDINHVKQLSTDIGLF